MGQRFLRSIGTTKRILNIVLLEGGENLLRTRRKIVSTFKLAKLLENLLVPYSMPTLTFAI